MSPQAAIRTSSLGKSYGSTQALSELNLDVPEGQFFGLLGPNGSGKTTAIHILSTLIAPTTGTAEIATHDVLTSGVAARREIGLVFQEPSLDPTLSVYETLLFAGRLRSLSKRQVDERGTRLLELFDLQGRAGDRVGALSGGMRRALDIARSLLHEPRILFLDEPTIGLDLPNRRKIWRHIEQVRRTEGTTVFLTTHYLQEAEACDVVAFLSKGRIVSRGNPQRLIEDFGRYVVEVEGEEIDSVVAALSEVLELGLREEDRALFRVRHESFDIHAVLGGTPDGVRSIHQRRPTLDDVFLWVNRPDHVAVAA